MNLREVTMKYGRLVVFMRHDSAEIWRFRYGIILGIGHESTKPGYPGGCTRFRAGFFWNMHPARLSSSRVLLKNAPGSARVAPGS